MRLTLTPDEARALSSLLESAIGELHDELRHTESSAYRQELHTRERALRSVLDRMTEAGAVVPG